MSRSIDARKRKASLVLVQGRSLAFGPVEEVPVQRYNSMIMILVWWSGHIIIKFDNCKQRTYQSLIYLVPKITVCKHENMKTSNSRENEDFSGQMRKELFRI